MFPKHLGNSPGSHGCAAADVTLPPCPSGVQSLPPPGRGHGQHGWPPAESRGRRWAPSGPGAAVANLAVAAWALWSPSPSHPGSVSPCTRHARMGSGGLSAGGPLWQAWAWPPGWRCPRTKVGPWRSPQGQGLWPGGAHDTVTVSPVTAGGQAASPQAQALTPTPAAAASCGHGDSADGLRAWGGCPGFLGVQGDRRVPMRREGQGPAPGRWQRGGGRRRGVRGAALVPNPTACPSSDRSGN